MESLFEYEIYADIEEESLIDADVDESPSFEADIEEGGAGTNNYPDLQNKPKINNVELVGNKSLSDLGINIPTKTSQLTNDSGFLTEHQSLANYYTKSETDSEISSHHDSTKQDVIDSSHKLSYSLLSDTPTIPTKTSELTNDSGFLTEHQSLADYDTKSEVNSKISVATNDMATKTWVEGKGYLTEHQSLSAYRTSANQDVIDDAIKSDIDEIEELIPEQATASNQLADKNFVNSSIATETAHYISNNGQPFTSVAQLEAYQGVVTNNDYAFVTGIDEQGNTYYDRYKATVGNSVTWAKEYRLNNSSFTSVQWEAISSGITASLVADIQLNSNARHTHSNKALLDSYQQTEVNLADAVTKKHIHSNKATLDSITSETLALINTALQPSALNPYRTASAQDSIDNEQTRRTNALFKLNTGQLYDFQTTNDNVYTKTVPTSGVGVTVKMIGGHSEVVNNTVVHAQCKKVNAIDIPQAIQNLDGYGWSAGNVYNYVDFAEKKFHKRVARVDLGSLTWVLAYSGFYAEIWTSKQNNGNALCSKYEFNPSANDYSASSMYSALSDKQFCWYRNQYRVFVKDTAYTDVATFKSAMSGVYLYYELREDKEVITDISSLIPNGFLESISVNGTVTYVNDAQLPMPTTNEWIIAVANDEGQLEKVASKVTSISSASTDTQYPSAKCVYDIVGNIESLLEALL